MLIAGLAGGVANFLLGWLVWGVLLAGFMAKNAGSATGVAKDPPEFWAIGLSSLAFGLLFALIYSRWAGIRTFTSGLLAGATIGALIAISFDFMMLATTNITTMNAVFVDILASTAVAAVVGGVVGWVLGTGKEAAA